MELDELKDIWKKSDADFRPKAESEIAIMLKGNSRSIVAKLKRSVWFELIFTLVAGILLLIYAATLTSGALKWISISILVVFVGYCFYYIKKLRLLNLFNPAEENLRGNIEKLIENLTGYLHFYKRSYAFLYPVYFFIALLFGAVERGLDEFLSVLMKPKTILYLLALAAFFFFCSTWLVNWFLKKLYGNHMEKLKGILRDLHDYEKPDGVVKDSPPVN